MGVIAAFTFGLVFWVCAWSLGVKSFDAFMVTALITVIAATVHLARPHLHRFIGREA